MQVLYERGYLVALHPEGVDRNILTNVVPLCTPASPSTRRAWIEISILPRRSAKEIVALHPEGVDRNKPFTICTRV